MWGPKSQVTRRKALTKIKSTNNRYCIWLSFSFILLKQYKIHKCKRLEFYSHWCCKKVVCSLTPNLTINNYWMRLSMISWLIKTWCLCYLPKTSALADNTDLGFDNSWYHAKTKFNNWFIIHFSHNSSSETEAKHSAILFLRRTLQGAE